MAQTYEYVAICLFGLERLVGEEIEALGYEKTNVMDGRVTFRAGIDAMARANLWLRYAERVYLKMGEFAAADFTQLFDGTEALPWEDWIGREDSFPVKGDALRSQLFSVPDCQRIVTGTRIRTALVCRNGCEVSNCVLFVSKRGDTDDRYIRCAAV